MQVSGKNLLSARGGQEATYPEPQSLHAGLGVSCLQLIRTPLKSHRVSVFSHVEWAQRCLTLPTLESRGAGMRP